MDGPLPDGAEAVADGGGQGVFPRVWAGQKRSLRLMRFSFWDMLWTELRFWRAVAVTLPERIRRRSWSLAEANKRDGIG